MKSKPHYVLELKGLLFSIAMLILGITAFGFGIRTVLILPMSALESLIQLVILMVACAASAIGIGGSIVILALSIKRHE